MENKIICVVGILLLIVAIIYFYRSQEQFKGSKPKGKSCNQMAVESCKTVRGQQHLTCVTDAKKQCPPNTNLNNNNLNRNIKNHISNLIISKKYLDYDYPLEQSI